MCGLLQCLRHVVKLLPFTLCKKVRSFLSPENSERLMHVLSPAGNWYMFSPLVSQKSRCCWFLTNLDELEQNVLHSFPDRALRSPDDAGHCFLCGCSPQDIWVLHLIAKFRFYFQGLLTAAFKKKNFSVKFHFNGIGTADSLAQASTSVQSFLITDTNFVTNCSGCADLWWNSHQETKGKKLLAVW